LLIDRASILPEIFAALNPCPSIPTSRNGRNLYSPAFFQIPRFASSQ